MKTKTSIITTVDHNIGDDFVREGLLYLLSSAGVVGDVELIHKHSPVSNFYGMERIRSLRASKVFEPIIRHIGWKNRIQDCSLLIQSGAPIYWCHESGNNCANNEWFDPLIRQSYIKRKEGKKFLNLAGGSCQRYHSDGSEVNQYPECGKYMRELYDACDLTVLRDTLAQRMLLNAGRKAAVLPCASIFAVDQLGICKREGEYIVINFMENGGHYTFGQNIDGARWRATFLEIAAIVEDMGKVVVACHNQYEFDLARELVPHLEAFLIPNNYIEFMRFYAGARFGVVNRVHSAFMLASLSKPAVVIGSDSRARMVENLNLKSYYVGDELDPKTIVNDVADIELSYGEVIGSLKAKVKANYLDLLADVL